MDILDFLPKYPNIDQTKYPVLNPYEGDFYEAIFHKKEFYELKLDRTEVFPKERGMLTKYQKTIARYMSSHTPYDRLLLVHQMGLGKCVLPDTIIHLNSGAQKIKDIWNLHKSDSIVMDEEGEWSKPSSSLYVDSYNENTKQIVKKPISQLYRQYVKETVRKITAQHYTISTTKAHKIFTEKGWTNSPENCTYIAIQKDLKISFVKITNIEEFAYEGWVYDLEVEQLHNYVANGIVTHNTCSAIGAIEQIKEEENTFDGALILAKGEGILDNFTTELVEKCTPGYYIPENYAKLTELEKAHRIKKKIKFYQMRTFAKFAKKLSKMSDNDITDSFSNKVIVIDEVHNLRPQEEQGSLETYKQFHRFLHIINNSKVLFLSGTPMKDSPEEIASVANLLLPLDQQLPSGEDFLNEFMTEKGNVYYIKPEKAMIIKEKLKGKISFLREPESTVPKEFIGEEKFGNLKHFVVAPNKMSSFQTKGYKNANDKDKSGKKGVYINSREASLFVYPDGSYGREGFKKYIQEVRSKKVTKGQEISIISHYKLADELSEVLRGDSDQDTLKNIRRHSATYAQVIEQILLTPGNCFVYSSLAQGSGGILFSLLLELFGFSKAKGREKELGLRYAILTNKTASSQDLRRISARFNKKDNMHGEFIKVIIGSKAVSEGYSFKNVLFESINTPHWNYSETAQALARGIRLGSHNDLFAAGEKPTVRILQPISMPKDNTQSIDLFLYETSEDKDISIRGILRLLMETAFDCAMNYMRNFVDGTDKSRECDYTTCNYKCDGIDMNEIKNGIDEKDIDYSTYQLYYANPKIPLVRRKIEQLFRQSHKIDLDSIIKNLNKQFTEEEIRNALYIIQEESESDEFDYRTFLNIYSHSSVKIIINELEEMFRHSFQLSFDNIITNFKNYIPFEILSGLQTIINDNMVLTNKYGLPCYLREEKNIYFLVNSLTVRPDFYTEYYTKYPHSTTSRSFTDIMNRIYSMSLPTIVNKICKTDNPKDFAKLMKTLPPVVQELFIEASLVAQDKDIEDSVDIRRKVLELFKSYIKQINNVWVSTFLDSTLRCCKTGADFEEWTDCDEKYNTILHEHEVERQIQLREDNPYGIMGKYNPENGSFCIVDFQKEQQAKEKVSGKREKGSIDKRVSYSGKVCGAGGWKLDELIAIAATRLKIPPPKDFRRSENIESMLARIKKEARLNTIVSDPSDKEELRRILYWGTPKKEKGNRGIKPICEALRKWFEENNLLEIDNQCGVQGKKKVSTILKDNAKKERVFRVEMFVPSKDETRFKAHAKDITKLMGECFDLKKYKVPIDDNTWIIVFSKKKLVGFIMIDKKNILWNVCVAKNYRRQGIAKEAMKEATRHICNIKGEAPSLLVDNRNKDAKKLIRMYNSFGFEVIKSDDRFTHLQHSCTNE
jgi:ribosomal protein S18 acetylase RimI-like enzyme